MSIPDVIEVGHVISALLKSKSLEVKYVHHSLTDDWFGYRDCDVKPDLVLIYKADSNILKLARIGSHSELFK